LLIKEKQMNIDRFLAFAITASSLVLLIENYNNPVAATAWAVAMVGWTTVYLRELKKTLG
jgi:hypothetical protein